MAKRRTFIFDGLGVSGGVVLGPAYVLETTGYEVEAHEVPPHEIDLEISRFHQAVARAIGEVNDLGRTVREKLDTQQAAIFEAHVTILGDPLLIDRTVTGIREERRNAEYVFWGVARDIGEQLKALGDVYFSERSHDLYDVARRVIKFLTELKTPGNAQIPSGSIIVANDLGPSETAALRRDSVGGFCTNTGGPTSHTAIMAKALSLPAVVGLDFVTHYVRTGDFLIIDGTEGKVILNPTPEQVLFYRGRAEDYREAQVGLAEFRYLPAVTQDGVAIRMEANIEFTKELSGVIANGAEGIGLYRTEYFFIERTTLPSEQEQEEAYAEVLAAMGDNTVVFRTIDVGGDKMASNLAQVPESNPFLGLRAIRLCLAYPEIFRCQLRPLLRAGAGRELNILLPMVCSVDEVVAAKRHINKVRDELTRDGVALPSAIRVGVMIEIPSAALMADALAEEADFFSIGTNDLVQYTLAVDRVNKMVGHLYQELHPAVLKLIHQVVKVCQRTGTPLTVCGEMAGNPMLALVLVGLGIRTLSMSPSLIGPVKKAIRSNSAEFLQEMAERLLTLTSPVAVRDSLIRTLNRHSDVMPKNVN